MSTAVTANTALDAAASRALGEAAHDSPKVAELRARAAQLASELGVPTPSERPWKYLDIRGFALDEYRPVSGGSGAEVPAIDGAYAGVVRQVDGETVSVEIRAQGLDVVPFERNGDARTQAIIDARLGTAVAPGSNRLTALHYAFERGGLLVHATKDAEIGEPVRIVRTLTAEKQLAAPHTLIVTEANSRVSVIEEYRSADGDIVVLPAVEILPGPGSEVRYTALHRWGNGTRVFAEQRTVTGKDASVVSLSVVTGGQVVKSHIESSLVGRGSSSELLGLGVGKGNQHADFYTTQDHIAADTRSDLLFKFALRDSSRSVYYGMTRVGLEARNADANQENRNLLLSKTAKADSDPVLEILTNNIIRASHGATAGPVDEEQLYYLEARALPHAVAERLLVAGFLSQVIDRIPDPALRDEVAAELGVGLGEDI
ncbi:MAG: SufD family Fe-S cluster assembly protein [Dehalococcoidia bacterium]|nr:SufD family Fe-S cluster assembly protein [Dehalococcoidia bacterium]